MSSSIDFIQVYSVNYILLEYKLTEYLWLFPCSPEKFCQIDFPQRISNTTSWGSCEDKATLEPSLRAFSPNWQSTNVSIHTFFLLLFQIVFTSQCVLLISKRVKKGTLLNFLLLVWCTHVSLGTSLTANVWCRCLDRLHVHRNMYKIG